MRVEGLEPAASGLEDLISSIELHAQSTPKRIRTSAPGFVAQ
jgi:hypothetical protein